MAEASPQKPVRKPKAPSPARNTFFWFAVVLFVVAVIGFVRGDEAIRDPGQVRETGIRFIYLGSAVVMAINGWLTHRHACIAYQADLHEYERQGGDDSLASGSESSVGVPTIES